MRLPTSPHDEGAATGALFDSTHHEPVYLLKAALTEHDHHGLSFRSGGIKGLLYDPDTHHPVYGIVGTWQGHHSAAEGFWKAEIFPLDGHEPIGKMAGNYHDPKPFKEGGDGKFKGKFVFEE